MYDSKVYEFAEGRVLVFTTKRNIEILSECDDWHVDGTFKVRLQYSVQRLQISIMIVLQVVPNHLHSTLYNFGWHP